MTRHCRAVPCSGISDCCGQADLRAVQAQPLGDLNLRAHNVDAGDHFGHRVFHLDARIHLDEEPLVGIRIDQKFDRAGVVVICGASECHGRVASSRTHPCPGIRWQAPLPPLFDGGAARSNRARRDAGCCRAGRRESEFRRAWRGECSVRGKPRRCRTRPPLPALASCSFAAKSPRDSTTRMPRPPPPKAALMISGKPISPGDVGRPAGSVTGSSVPGTTGCPLPGESAGGCFVPQQI